MEIKYYKNSKCLSISLGGTNGENFMILAEFFRKPLQFRLTIAFNTNKLIKFFGFNQKIISIGF